MATIRLKLNITGNFPPFEYRLQGTEAWQDYPVFEVPELEGAGGYTVEVKDANECVKAFEIYEEEIGLELIGGYVTPDLTVYASYGSNIPVQARINWGIGEGYPFDPSTFLGTTEWTEDFTSENRIPFPVSFTGSLHFFQAMGRSRLGQRYTNSIRGIFYVPSEIEVIAELSTNVESSEVFIPLETTVQTNNITITSARKNKANPSVTLSTSFESSTKPTVKENIQENIGNIHATTIVT